MAAFPKSYFPAIHDRRDNPKSEPSSSHNNEGTKFGHVRTANADNSGAKCGGVWRYDPLASAERVVKSRKGRSQACGDQTRNHAHGYGQRRTDADRPVWYLRCLHCDTERQENVLRTSKTLIIENQSSESPARPSLCLCLHAPGGKSYQ